MLEQPPGETQGLPSGLQSASLGPSARKMQSLKDTWWASLFVVSSSL